MEPRLEDTELAKHIPPAERQTEPPVEPELHHLEEKGMGEPTGLHCPACGQYRGAPGHED